MRRLMRWGLIPLLPVLVTCLAGGTAGSPRDLTFGQRVAAQRAIERVYYSHQIGATLPFDEAVPRELVERKVQTYLRQSVALEKIWRTPVTARMLRKEMLRIAGATRLPERLEEIYRALGNDPFVIQETLVRAALVDRLSRSFLAGDPSMRGPAREAVQAWWARTAPTLDPTEVHAVSAGALASLATPCVADDTWDNGILDDLPAARIGHTAVWTGSLMIIWGGQSGQPLGSGSRYDPVIDTWSATSMANAPSPRRGHTAVWTGTRMIAWGGSGPGGVGVGNLLDTGALYDPVADTWTPTSTGGAPLPRAGHAAVWTGSQMIVWGGGTSISSRSDDGGRYDPAADTWMPTSLAGAPAPRSDGHTAVWTGAEMIIWGGVDNTTATRLDTGALYNPAANTWRPMLSANPPAPRSSHTAVWTGARMIVWGGGDGGSSLDSGGRYDPAADTWAVTSMADAPDARERHTAIWTGSRMLIWGGNDLTCCDSSDPKDSGGLYDPVGDAWSPTSLSGAPAARDSHTAVWAGDRMIVWGGQRYIQTITGPFITMYGTGGRYDPAAGAWTPTSQVGPPGGSGHTTVWTGTVMIDWGGFDQESDAFTNAGGRYDPMLDVWSPTSMAGAPSPRSGHAAAWTGSEMILWGGGDSLGLLGDGARYSPAGDAWTSLPASGAPTRRTGHTAVWTGSRLLLWGGSDPSGRTDTGGVFNPANDEWDSTSTVDAPAPRSSHIAVWTGSSMAIWGGRTGASTRTNSGGLYDPGDDTWTEVSLTGAPSARDAHTAVWADGEMIVWGGATGVGPGVTNTGGRYDPGSGSWTATSTAGAPAARSSHTAVWSGQAMVVWGGSGLDTGGRYDPASDGWTPTSTAGAPAGRSGHKAVWTGAQMLVWGGGSTQHTGGRYGLAQSPDDDLDGFTVCGGDCDDADPLVNPGAVDLPGNSLDENCDGQVSCDPAMLWRNRGEFLRCVARTCGRLVDEDLLPPQRCGELVRQAAQSQVVLQKREKQARPLQEP